MRTPRREPTQSSMATGTPSAAPAFAEKVELLQRIDAYLRGRDPKVRQVTASLAAAWQVVNILRADGQVLRDSQAHDPAQCQRRGGRRRPAGKAAPTAPAAGAASENSSPRTAGRPVRMKRCGRRSSISRPPLPRPALSTSCWAPAGRVSCCTKRSATVWRAISTAKKHRHFPVFSASRSQQRA